MSDTGAAKGGLMNIGEEAKPPFAVLPDLSNIFLKRSRRFTSLAPGHKLESYLLFLADLTGVQHEILSLLPITNLPPPAQIAQALANGMPPLTPACLADAGVAEVVRLLLAEVAKRKIPAQTAAAIKELQDAPPEALAKALEDALDFDAPSADVAQRVLLIAALQVHAARLAGQLDADSLQPIADGICPACGHPPAASAVVGWPKAHNSRFCMCSLCGTQWNVVRVKCVLCSETGGITYQTIEGQSDAVKAETCSKCGHYVKINYQVHHPDLEAFADDVATLGLDLLMREGDWRRGGRNLFLLGL